VSLNGFELIAHVGQEGIVLTSEKESEIDRQISADKQPTADKVVPGIPVLQGTADGGQEDRRTHGIRQADNNGGHYIS
jgi:hypothetical protein